MKKIGIECESLEGKRFGVGQALAQFLNALTLESDVEKNYKFVLYFKKEIPKDVFLNHPIFEKKILTGGWIPTSFNIFYHILLPIYHLKDRLDILFLPSYMLPAFFFSKKALVVLTNDVYYEAYFGSIPFRYRLSYMIFCAWAAKRAKKIMTISEFAKKELMRFYNLPDEKIFVNPWGLEDKLKVFERSEDVLKRMADIKQKLGIRNDFILSIGQAFDRRRVKEAVEAFGKIAEKFPNVQYLVPCVDKNNPPILDALAEEINKKLGRKAIIRETYVDRADIPYLFNFAKLLIYVSDKEALGLPPVEALACGTPSVVIDNDLSREIFENRAFFVKNPKNIDEYASVIDDALTDMKKINDIIGDKDKILSKFNWSRHVKKTLKEIDAI